MMSALMEILTRRAGHNDLPDDVGPDPEPSGESDLPQYQLVEELPPPPPGQINPPPRPVLHLTDADFARAATSLNVSVPIIRAVAHVEAAGRGFHNGSGIARPVILYEAHVFGRLTSHRHQSVKDTRGNALSSRNWNRALYGPAGEWQHNGRLAPAARLNREAALRACSWGFFQIMGENHRIVGHPTIQGFVNAMYAGAGHHLDAFVEFIKSNKLETALRTLNWREFARRYNGPGFEQNQYHIKLAEAFKRFSTT